MSDSSPQRTPNRNASMQRNTSMQRSSSTRRNASRKRTPRSGSKRSHSGLRSSPSGIRLPTSLRVSLDDDEDVQVGEVTTQEKWARIRTTAFHFLSLRKPRYDELVFQRHERLKEMGIYVAFACLFTYVAMQARATENSHFMVAGIINQLEQQELPYTVVPNFFFYYANILQMSDVWNYLTYIIMPTVFPNMAQNQRVPIVGNNLIIGPVRIRQVRTQALTCTTPPIFSGMNIPCYPSYTKSNAETSNDPDGTWLPCYRALVGNPNATYQPWMQYEINTLPSFANSLLQTDYGNDGYVIEIGPSNISIGYQQFLAAQQCGWFSSNNTRGIFVEMAFYNPSINLVGTAVYAMENIATGTINPSSTWRAVELTRYLRTASVISLALEFIVYFFVLVFFIFEYRNFKVYGAKAYFSDGYNYIAILNLLIFIVVAVLEMYSIITSSSVLDSVETEPENYQLQGLSFYTYQVYNWNSFNALLTWVRLVKYLDIISKKTTQLAATLGRAGIQIGALGIVFVIIYFGYALAFLLAFGQDIDTFCTMADSLFGLFLAILGTFDFDGLYEANRVLGPILFFSFVCVVYFILLNMFLAVIMKSYEEVTFELEKTKDELASFMRRSLRRWYKGKLRVFLEGGDEVEEETFDSYLNPSELQKIYKEDEATFLSMGITDWRQIVRICDLGDDWGIDLEDLAQVYDELTRTAIEREKENQLAYLLLNIVERTNAIVQEQQLMRSYIEKGMKSSSF